jgi:hypothetical protein
MGPNRRQTNASRGRSGDGSLAEQFYTTRMTEQREKSAGSSRSFKQGQGGRKERSLGSADHKESSGQRTRESSGRKALIHSGRPQWNKPVAGRGNFGKKPSAGPASGKDRRPKL